MIERRGKYYFLFCESCDIEIEFDCFEDAAEHKKANGWKSVKVGVDWFDYCPECKELLKEGD